MAGCAALGRALRGTFGSDERRTPAGQAGGRRGEDPSRPVSRILSETVICLGRKSPSVSSDLPGDGAGHTMVPLRDLAAGRACPFHPARAGSSLWRWSSPHGGRVLPASLPCAVRTFLDGFRRRDRPACSDLQFTADRDPADRSSPRRTPPRRRRSRRAWRRRRARQPRRAGDRRARTRARAPRHPAPDIRWSPAPRR